MSDVDRMQDGAFGVRRPEHAPGLAEALQRQEAFTQATELRARVERLTATVGDVVAQRDELADQLGGVQARLRVARAANEGFAREYDSHLDRLRDSENELGSARARIEELESQVEELSCDLTNANARVETLEGRLRADDAWTEREEWKRMHGERVAELEGARARIAELEAERGKLLDERSAGDAVAQSLTKQIEKVRLATMTVSATGAEIRAKLRAARAVLHLAVDVFDRYRDQDVEWDSGTPDEILTKWEGFVEAIGPHFT